ncbi:hypothetical protein FRB94_000570 [Tulasnella sp. JGI-2019a]|nr:hypothetical protein FRB94_000570 [Tulasnella sp. JGI-2019a]KAG9002094.1 hypothetical protein FRB93_011867 [Tulasnella sp. JGI-2019a]
MVNGRNTLSQKSDQPGSASALGTQAYHDGLKLVIIQSPQVPLKPLLIAITLYMSFVHPLRYLVYSADAREAEPLRWASTLLASITPTLMPTPFILHQYGAYIIYQPDE